MTPDPIPHAYGCECQQCKAMIAAIVATNPDGTSFFSDSELYRLAMANNCKCECELCQLWRQESEQFA